MIDLTKTEIILAVGGALVSVVGLLWSLFMKSINERQKRLNECEQKHEHNTQTIVKLTEDVYYLKGQMDGVKSLSKSVLEKLDQCRDKVKNQGLDA